MTFEITLAPTAEMYDAPINGVMVPVRIWAGQTSGGVPIEAYVLSITPNEAADAERMRAELPPFMIRSRDLYKIDMGPEAEIRADRVQLKGEGR